MKMKKLKMIPVLLLALVTAAALIPAAGAASGDIYVNDGGVLSGSLDSAYAVGGSGTAPSRVHM